MSLLEDVFLQDEAGEAQELERVIEGDDFEEKARSDSDDNSEKEDEAEEDKRRVEPNTTKTHRVVKNPRFILNPARLTGPRGIQVIPEHFKDFKFKGKGHEKEDLDLVLKRLEHWAYRLYPKFKFQDCLKKIETLGKKRPVMVHLHKIRTDQYISEETVVQNDSSNEEDEKEKAPEDEFDKLLQQQIELARATPAPGSVRKNLDSAVKENRPIMLPNATSSPSISDEQKERMLRNRKLAEERRQARLKSLSIANNSQSNESNNIIIDNDNSKANNENGMDTENINDTAKRNNNSNISDSSDDEVTAVNTSISVDVHKNNEENNDSTSNEDNLNNVLRIDTDSDTEIDKNDGVNNLNNEDKKLEPMINANEGSEINEKNNEANINEVAENNDESQNDEDDNEIQLNVDKSQNNESSNQNTMLENNDEMNNELNSTNDNETVQNKDDGILENGVNDEKSAEKVNEDIELMDVDFDEDF